MGFWPLRAHFSFGGCLRPRSFSRKLTERPAPRLGAIEAIPARICLQIRKVVRRGSYLGIDETEAVSSGLMGGAGGDDLVLPQALAPARSMARRPCQGAPSSAGLFHPSLATDSNQDSPEPLRPSGRHPDWSEEPKLPSPVSTCWAHHCRSWSGSPANPANPSSGLGVDGQGPLRPYPASRGDLLAHRTVIGRASAG